MNDFDSESEVIYPIDGTLDLHLFRPKDIPDVVASFIDACMEDKIYELRIIHGKGKGVQRARVASILSKHPKVVKFKTAGEDAGGWGATLVDLEREA